MKRHSLVKLMKTDREIGGEKASGWRGSCSSKRQMSRFVFFVFLVCGSFLSAISASAADVGSAESTQALRAIGNQKDLLGMLMAQPACPSCIEKKPPIEVWGSENGGGDVSYVCDKPLFEGLRDLDFSEYVYLADTVELLRNSHDWDAYRRISSDDLLRVALSAIREESPRLAEDLSVAISSFTWQFVDRLERLHDDKIRSVPKGCRIEQLAVQDRSTGVIRVKTSLHGRLSNLEMALLKLHEAYIQLQTPEEVQARNTTRIRERVAALVSTPEFKKKMQHSRWCWSNPAHAYTALFFEEYFSSRLKKEFDRQMARGEAQSWFDAAASLSIETLFPISPAGMGYRTEELTVEALSENLEGFMVANGAISERDGRNGAIYRAFSARRSLTLSEMAHIVDQAFHFKNEEQAKAACLKK